MYGFHFHSLLSIQGGLYNLCYCNRSNAEADRIIQLFSIKGDIKFAITNVYVALLTNFREGLSNGFLINIGFHLLKLF